MNNPLKQFKYVLLLCIGMIISPVLMGQHQVEHSSLLGIQSAYIRGEINADEAILEQFKALYEPGDSAQVHKCATPAFMFYHQHEAEIQPSTREKVHLLRQQVRPKAQQMKQEESYTSPGGKFEIIYQTSGVDSVSVVDEDSNGIPDYIDWTAEAADSSYRHEVQRIGFTDPIPDGGKYRIYVINTGGSYGYTETGSSSGAETDIYVENDFIGFPPNTHPEGNQKGALFATIAHEFKHAIQYEQNRWRSPSGAFNWAEMDATLMEEVVYDDVNDYYNYIKNGLNSGSPYFESIFYAPENSTPGAYWHVSWMIFYTEYFGNQVWRDVWEMIEAQNDLPVDEALEVILPDYGESFETLFVRNHLWHFASGSRASSDDYGFEEKQNYPYANMEEEFSGVPVEDVAVDDISPLAARYFEVTPSALDEGTADIAIDFDSSQVGLGLLFYLQDGTVEEYISTGMNKSQVYVPTELNWQDIERLGIVVANYSNEQTSRRLSLLMGKSGNVITIRDPEYANLPRQIRVYQNYPNPFNPTTNIDFDLPRASQVKLEVYDVMGRRIQTMIDGTYKLGSYSIPFNGGGLSSGTYFYRLQIDELTITKKMMLVK